jgi:hypothetical protein
MICRFYTSFRGRRTSKSVDLEKSLITDVLLKNAGAEGSCWFKAMDDPHAVAHC